ncbi:ATP-binding protein [Pseudonocardia broussonetiae]|uniref:ATP-binding protein n=1 Tax=Pseudonocardia broussonetiae TaxID=2736640 RepID=A0A6M6JT55_9PSEU|nr:ATP-binding protein [Pseudonocardia broussonetiae]
MRPAVLDGELIDEQAIPRPRPHLIGRAIRARAEVVTVLGASTTAATTGRAGRRVLAVGWTTGQGVRSTARRAWRGMTHGVEREQVRLAELAGDREAVGKAAADLRDAKTERMKRLLELPRAVLGLAVLAAAVLGLLLVLLFAGAVVAQVTPGGTDWAGWWAGVGSVLAVVSTVLHVLVVVLGPVLAVPVLVYAAWREGQRAAEPPMWLLAPEDRPRDELITPSKVIVALRDLGIAPLRAALKEAGDAGAALLSPIAVAGCGVEVDVLLPSGVSTDQIQARRRRLAENLDRHEHELHITVSAARTVRLWIADSGALDEPIGPSPLVTDKAQRSHYRSGRAPWGLSLRGDPVAISLYQRHLLITGLSNQGKTAALRALALWLAFDVRVQFWIADLKGFGDWSMFSPLAEVLIEGPTDDHVIAATEMLERAVYEMDRRLQQGGQHDPLIVIVDEAQVAYLCPEIDDEKRPYGGAKNTSRFFMAARKIQNQGRAVDVLLHQGTQDPTNQNLPKLIREGAHIRASLVVGTEEQARMAVGDKAVDGGAAPHLLRQGLDKGALVVAGDGVDLPAGQVSTTIRTHFIDTEPAAQVARRAVERRRKRARGPAVTSGEPDHMAAIEAALRGETRVRTTVVLARLMEADAAAYEGWDLPRLTEVLTLAGAPPLKSSGVMYVVSERVLTARGEAS